MSVRRKLLGGFLLVAVSVGIALRLEVLSARRAAITEARHVAQGIRRDVSYGPVADSPELISTRGGPRTTHTGRFHTP